MNRGVSLEQNPTDPLVGEGRYNSINMFGTCRTCLTAFDKSDCRSNRLFVYSYRDMSTHLRSTDKPRDIPLQGGATGALWAGHHMLAVAFQRCAHQGAGGGAAAAAFFGCSEKNHFKQDLVEFRLVFFYHSQPHDAMTCMSADWMWI